MPAITVAAVIPLYNGAPFIREALESVLRQTVPADEIIVVDDGSTDDGAAIVEEMAQRHPVTLLHKPNGGQSSARNLAVRHTRCSHVAFLDQDDAWYEDHIEVLRRPFLVGTVRNLGLVYGNLDQVDRSGRMIRQGCLDDIPAPHPKRSLAQCLQHDLFILPGATLAAKDAMIAAGLFDERLSGYEDDDLFVRMYSMGFRSTYLNTPVTKWRIYSGSTSFSRRMAKSRMIYFKKLLQEYPDDPRLNLYWGRDVIGPRFFHLVCNDFFQASKAGDRDRLRQAWSDILEVLPVLRQRVRLRVQMVRPLVAMLYLGPLTGITRNLLRRAIR
ncbi:glycosyltransferase family 2 protein [Xanthobacter sp. AM11]|uniref:glycosyltransferase family 2 protein n=1 Tax=Xanthobacter sp. AM11 TaxID=3380643 RepID=UPI0039BEF880